VVIHASIDRIDRLPGSGIEVIGYKTGKVSSQKSVDECLQRSIYALACSDALGEFTAMPGEACQWCEFRAMCPERGVVTLHACRTHD
jgi:RecB family exonuclease